MLKDEIMSYKVTVLGAGLAGCEAALWLAGKGVQVTLYEQKPTHFSPAHKSAGFAELICSNSLKAERLDSASGLLKEEMRRMGSQLLEAAEEARVAAGGALAVDRDAFSAAVTRRVEECPNITVVREQVEHIDESAPILVATGPLTDGALADEIGRLTGDERLHFYDAVAPIVTAESLDYNKVFAASRYDRGEADYLNCPFNKAEYEAFHAALASAERAPLHAFDAGAEQGAQPDPDAHGKKADTVTVEGVSSPDYPLQKKRHSVEYLRTIQHLRPRTNLFSAAFRVRSAAAYAVHEFFQSRGFVYVNTPIITGSDCEGAGEMFQVTTLDLENPPRTPDGKVDYSKDFFGKKTSLTVSGQLNAENFAMAFGDVYTFGPTFRAENSNTARHAAEFWMIEPEMAFCDLDGDLEVMEAMVKHIIRRVMERCPDDLAFFNSFVDKGLLERLQHVESSDFGRVTYTEAVKLLKESGQKFDYPVEWGIDLQTEHERYLTEQIFKRPVFVTDYPQEIKAFYMRLNDDGKTVAAADCLVPGIGEIIGGSQREERIELLEKRIRELGMNPEDYWWYCDLRRYGSCRHAGFGLGFERMVMYLTGIGNIRDVELHPRTVGNADF